MLQHETALSGTDSRPAGTPPLTAVAPVAPRTRSVPVSGEKAPAEAPAAALSVQYALDQASQRWVATIVDEASGQIITTVPSPQVLHLLATLRTPSLDVRA